jgi:tetratricopeptide (TPR) repeat protein
MHESGFVAREILSRAGEECEASDCSGNIKVTPVRTIRLGDRSSPTLQTQTEPVPARDRALTSRQLLARALELHQRGQLAAADALYQRALQKMPGLFAAQHLLGVLRSQQGRYAEALALVSSALQSQPNSIGALTNHGLILHNMQRYEQALASFDKALTLRPDHALALNNRGNALAALGRDVEALDSYWRALKTMPNYADAYNNMGVLLKELGRLAEAEAALSKALEFDPKLTGAYINLADCKRFRSGDSHLMHMQALVHDQTQDVTDRVRLHFALGKAYADLGDHRRAFENVQRGNAEKRTTIIYDESAMMKLFDRTAAVLTRDRVRAKENRGIPLGDPSTLPIFVIGMPGSGTTLVEQILASHHDVHGAGELATFSEVAGSVYGPDGHLVGYPDFVAECHDDVFRAIGSYFVAALRKLAPRARQVVDKMPSNFIFAGLIHLALPNARIIHVVRDPIDTCVSCYFRLFTGNLDHTYDLAELGRFYRRYQKLMDHWRDVLPEGRMLEVRYEDVVGDLETASRRILAHCGLDWDPHCLRFHQTGRRVRTASAIQVRQEIYRSSIGRWRDYQPYLGPLLQELLPADHPDLAA